MQNVIEKTMILILTLLITVAFYTMVKDAHKARVGIEEYLLSV